ncbi:tyrosine-protein kinase domain-containing protein [Deinococcus sp. RIT780]|uniref:tyrosine-protein kinase domain-containing protein n=1 Tax=Deinococcus sp. RIT780 TaxID=2870472 RepID=UPI001C89AED9|nr:tyrosine-protein kinase domain-containing protein [Deinococcus sp. RIT780]MBX8464007.1 AAA family ATPase [Deinococcus sp. RIT780]
MTPASEDLDLTRSFGALRRSAWLLILLAALAGAATYFVFREQTPLYRAETMILSAGSQTGNQRVNDTLVSAPPLPPGAIKGALNSQNVQGVVRDRLNEIPELKPGERAQLAADLTQAISTGKGETLTIAGQSDLYGNGTFMLSALHENPRVAAKLANLAGNALLAWDTQRGLVKVTAAADVLRLQLTDIERRIAQTGADTRTPSSLRQTLLTQRSDRLDALNRLLALEKAVVGSLTVVAPAAVPSRPIAPKPTRNAVLVGAFVLVLLSAGVMVRASLNRRVGSDRDLKELRLRLMGEVPRLRLPRRGRSLLVALRLGRYSDSVGFLSAGIRNVLPDHPDGAPIVMVTSLFSGDGKSSMTASIADSRAASGERVLLIDADLRRPSQMSLWQMAAHAAEWVNLPGADPLPGEEARDLLGALQQPDRAQARRLRENLHLISPRPASHDPGFLSSMAFRQAVAGWRGRYDLILVDCPPALAVADPLMLAPYVDGVLIVLAADRATMGGVQRLLDALVLANANVLGVVLNKVNPRERVTRYGYGYTQRPSVPLYRADTKEMKF